MKNYYDILNLNKNCTQEDIKKKYKILAMKNHPDKGGDENKVKDISEAYQVLIDPIKRQNYDNNNISNLNSVINANDLFQSFFAGKNSNIFGNKVSININDLFNELNNDNNFINETRNIYIAGDKKIEKIIQNKNGCKTEITIETNLKTGVKKQLIKQIR